MDHAAIMAELPCALAREAKSIHIAEFPPLTVSSSAQLRSSRAGESWQLSEPRQQALSLCGHKRPIIFEA